MRTTKPLRTPVGTGRLNSSHQSFRRAGLSNPGSDFRRSERSTFGRCLLYSGTHSDALVGQTVKSILIDLLLDRAFPGFPRVNAKLLESGKKTIGQPVVITRRRLAVAWPKSSICLC